MRWLLLGLLLGCGAKSGLDLDGHAEPRDLGADDDHDLGRPIDLGAADAGPGRSCETSCGFCTSGPRVRIDEWGQSPDLTWDGEKLLVVYDTREGNSVAAVDLDGRVRWREPLGGTQQPRIAYDHEAGAGLVVFDSGLRWLGADGRPMDHPDIDIDIDIGFQIGGDVAVTSSGFLLMIGAIAWVDTPGLYFDRTGRLPGASMPRELTPEGPQAPPEHAVDDSGRATYVAAATYAGAGAIYPAGAGGVPTPEQPLDPTNGRVFGIAPGADADLFVLRADGDTDQLALERYRAGSVSEWPVPTAIAPFDGHMLAMGRSLAIASSAFGMREVGLVCGNVREPGDLDPRAVLRVDDVSRAVRMARHPRGVALTWIEGAVDGSRPVVQILDCCVAE